MKKVAVERKTNVSPADFVREHIDGVGKPVVVTDAMDGWRARTKWTFDFFRDAYGRDLGTAPLGLHGEAAKVTKLATYIDHIDSPASVPGFWVDTKNRRPLQAPPESPTALPYLMEWPAFQLHPELYDDIKPAPYFVADWTLAFDTDLRELFQTTCGRSYCALFLGPEGSLSQLHQDFWHTHAYLAQIHGRKRATLFSPEDSEFLYGGKVDPEQPDVERFPLFERATAYECVIEPGDVLFIPPDWWHHVRGLEKSITMSNNFFNETNFAEHMTRILRKLPTLVQAIEQFPRLREALRIDWHLKSGEPLEE